MRTICVLAIAVSLSTATLATTDAAAFSIKKFTKKLVKKAKKEVKKSSKKIEDTVDDAVKSGSKAAEAAGKELEKLPDQVEKQLDAMSDFFEKQITEAAMQELRGIARAAVGEMKEPLSVLASSGRALVGDAKMRAAILRLANPSTDRQRARADLATVSASPHTQRIYGLGAPGRNDAAAKPDKLDSPGSGIPKNGSIYVPATFSVGIAAGAEAGAGAEVGTGALIAIPEGNPVKGYVMVGGAAGVVLDASVSIQLGLWMLPPADLVGCDMADAVEGGEGATGGVLVVFNTPCFDDGKRWNKFVLEEILKRKIKPSGYVFTFGVGGGLPVAATIAGGYSKVGGF